LPTLLPYVASKVPRLVRCVAGRINQNRNQLRVIVGLAVQEEEARLCCDCDTDFVGKFKAAATFEVLFGQKDLNMT